MKTVLRNLMKSIEKRLSWNPTFSKYTSLRNFTKTEIPLQVLSCEFCKKIQKSDSMEHLHTAVCLVLKSICNEHVSFVLAFLGTFRAL